MNRDDESNYTVRPLTIDDIDQYNALLRYAFQVTEQELYQIKSTAGQCGMTRSDFIRARALNSRPRQRLSVTEVDGLRQLAACRTDMVNFANALHGLNDDEKVLSTTTSTALPCAASTCR